MTDVAKRMGTPNIDGDYKLANEKFTLYIPKEPSEDGTYGVMTSVCFTGYGYWPTAWTPILDKYHIIWITPQSIGNNRETDHRVGLMLDAVAAAEKNWKIDPRRVYVSVGCDKTPAIGVSLDYPDVFKGTIYSLGWGWYMDVQTPQRRVVPSSKFARPTAAMLKLDQKNRFFCAMRGEDPAEPDMGNGIMNAGFRKAGIGNVQLEMVGEKRMGHWVNYADDWFEQGVKFLDAGLADANESTAQGVMKKSVPASAAEARSNNNASPAAAPAGDKAAAAQRQLAAAKSYIAAGSYEPARNRLQKILDTDPGTPAAAEAQSLMKEIEGK